MMHEEIAHYLSEKLQKKGADDVIVQFGEGESSLIKFVNSKISTTKTWSNANLGVFIAKDKKIMVSSLKEFNQKAADELANKMMQNIRKLQPNKEYRGIAKGPYKYKDISQLYDKKIEDMDEEMIDITKQGIEAAGKTAKRVSGVFEKSKSEVLILSSNNIHAREKGSSLYFSLRALANKNASGYGSCVSRMKDKLNFIDIAEHAGAIAKQALLPRKSIAGKFDVLFEPYAFAAMVERFADSASIFNVESGLSCLEKKQGKKIGNSKVSIYDDGTIPNGFASALFDDEGTPTQRTAILEKGVLKNYLHNTSSAKRYKTKSTGNAGLISQKMNNIILEKGNASKEEMFKSIKKGIYISNVWYTRFQNYQTGDFSTIPRDGAFYIENGKIKYALKDIRISENILNLMQNVAMLGKETHQVKTWEVETPTFLPYTLVKNVNITKPN
ncbi:TldD/PmbA family protein [Candidatus Woesearchaeota archaeon]|nr:TldD/PmbA family protein [Candidatus Woesearchaeota archaeon]